MRSCWGKLTLLVASRLGLVACGQCPSEINGMHNGDTLRTTILGPYPGPSSGVPCVGLNDIVPGTTFTLSASGLGNEGEECGEQVYLAIVSSSSPPGSLAPDAGNEATTTVGTDGCTGSYIVRFEATSPKASVFHDDPDGGPYQTYFQRVFDPERMGDSGACPVQATCTDDFVASTRLVN
jgi:hypothetical protein